MAYFPHIFVITANEELDIDICSLFHEPFLSHLTLNVSLKAVYLKIEETCRQVRTELFYLLKRHKV